MKTNSLMHKVFLAAAGLLMGSMVHGATVADYQAAPPELTQKAAPLVLFALGLDQQLFKKAYTDYSDLTGDGTYNTTYDSAFDYIGYFNHELCYRYNAGEFLPSSAATGSNSDECGGTSDFSGNFMNWATMTRADILRKVMFGGMRSTDTTTKTVLERSYLAEDIHAFAKPVSGDVTVLRNYLPNDYLPSSGTAQVTLCNLSQGTSSSDVPLIRVANGNWPEWAAADIANCQWTSERDATSNPPTSDNLVAENTESGLTARIVRCDSSVEGPNYSESCRQYPNGNYKTVGMLQDYGEDGRIRFGLMSGSYHQNHRGGLLRKNLSFFGGNQNADHDEINLATGVFQNPGASIVETLSTIRLAQYDHGNNKYSDCNSPGITVSQYLDDVDSTRHCSNWGNPLAEIYLEALRYIAGAGNPTPAFNNTRSGYTENDLLPGLGTDDWDDPYGQVNECANCSVIVISAGKNSFDGDDLGSITDLPYKGGSFSLTQLREDFVNKIGDLEYEFPGEFFDGSGTNCKPTTLNNLSSARGICPESPQLQGTYDLAGLAYYARTQDLRPDLDGRQTVQTFSMQLAEALPEFEFEVGADTVAFTPVCNSQADANGPWNGCSIGDVMVEEISDNYGRLVVVWEDSLWGNDYEMDAIHVIEWCVGGVNCDNANGDWENIGNAQFKIRNSMRSCAAGFGIRIGVNLSGAGANDGLIDDWEVGREDGCDAPPDPVGAQTTAAFSAGGSAPAITLQDPMWLAAKYGGFRDIDSDGTPQYDPDNTGSSISDIEWDARDNTTGESGPDGIPDNYFLARNPAQFSDQLSRVLSSLVARVASGSNAAVVSNTRSGTGSIYQAIYQPRRNQGGSILTWTGELQGIFIDGKNQLREGGPSLVNYVENPRITVDFDEDLGITAVQRYSTPDNGNTFIPQGEPVPLSELNALWKGGEGLSEIPSPNITSQRDYDASANLGRHILTNANGSAIPFTSSGALMADGTWQLTGASSADVATDIIDYSRGKEVAGYRSRTFRDDNGNQGVWRLGDIIHSSPTVVDRPSDVYDLRFGDPTYRAFKDQYSDRRRMVYVGANDGMLHAFNGGFWNPQTQSFDLSKNGETAHPLGSELWAFVPRSNLPHLRWLTEVDYPHVYYVDGDPVTFDARIFAESATHPHGWGTVMVVGMRLGGGPITVNNEEFSSSYLVLDITDPEQPPELITEITHEMLGYTTSVPQLVRNYRPQETSTIDDYGFDPPAESQWRLVFGSGPNGVQALSHGTSEQPAKLFMYDLVTQSFLDVKSGGPQDPRGYHALADNSLIGNPLVVDINRDAVDDVVYVGRAEGSQNNMNGDLYRWPLSTTLIDTAPTVMLQTGAPVLARPSFALIDNRYWVYVGTGKSLSVEDTINAQQQYFYGVQDEFLRTGSGSSQIDNGNIVDTTQVRVFENSAVRELSGGLLITYTPETTDIATYQELMAYVRGKAGWRVAMESGVEGIKPSGRVTRTSTIFDDLVLFPEYVPSINVCDATGNSYLYALSLLTGTSTASQPLGSNSEETLTSTDGYGDSIELEAGVNRVDLGHGEASSVTMLQDESGENVSAITTSSDGSIDLTSVNTSNPFRGRQSWREVNINF